MTTIPQSIVSVEQLASLLQTARRNQRLTQEALAARLGISQARMSELERQPGTLSVAQFLALCQQLRLQLSISHRPRNGEKTNQAEW